MEENKANNSPQQTLRNRKRSENSGAEEPAPITKENPPVDPLYWFGGLPSMSLRNSQKEFQSGLLFIPFCLQPLP